MFSCTFCGKTVQSNGALSLHVLSHTKEKPHMCSICKETFGYKSSLNQHMKTVHDGVKNTRNKKTPCGFKTKSQIGLDLHVRRVHSNEKLFACKVSGCNFLSKNKMYLRTHTSRAHSDGKPFKCSICDFRSKVKQDITAHQRIHMTTKRFHCQAPNCDFSTNWKYSAKLHFDAKHRKKNIRCTAPGCNYWCGSMTLLKIHLKVLHEKPILKCPVHECHFVTRFKQELFNHISRFHEDIQPAATVGPVKFDLEIATVDVVKETLQCCVPNCGYQTKFRQHYNSHRITHKNEEKYQHVCPFCFCRFIQLHLLETHIQRHIREKPHSCSFCKYAAISGGELKRHAASMHHIHVSSRKKEDEVRKCLTCGRNCYCYSEFVVHSMTHLQAVVVLEKLNVQTL